MSDASRPAIEPPPVGRPSAAPAPTAEGGRGVGGGPSADHGRASAGVRTGPGGGPAGSPAGPPRRGPRTAFILVVLLTLASLAAGGAVLSWALGPVDAGDARPVPFEVRAGAGAASVARDLEAAGLLRDHRALVLVLRWRGDQGRVGEGLYDLRRDLTATEIADALVRGGRPRTARFVLPEGIRATEVVTRIAAAGWVDDAAAEVADLVADPPADLRPAGLPGGAGLEGYLFPATYELPAAFDARQIVGALVARFEREVDEAVLAEVERSGLDLHAWVTLGSMVQAEAGDESEMGIIAGVFVNRLEIGMPLQSDPTVAYGLGKELPALDFPGGDFDVDHPWNTYTRPALPAGPIGNPGSAALAAVLAPTRTDATGRPWLYFLHGNDGGAIVFRPNLDLSGHLRDVERYLR